MSHLFFFAALILIFCSSSFAQKRWDGGAGDGQWSNPVNWNNNTVPVSTDDVVLDNSLKLSSYTVKLPAGNVSVTVKTIIINPGTSDSIELILPSTNTSAAALVVTGPGYGSPSTTGVHSGMLRARRQERQSPSPTRSA